MKTPKIYAFLLLAFLGSQSLNAADSPALTLARQLNQAFIEVAEKVTPTVVIVSIVKDPALATMPQPGVPGIPQPPRPPEQRPGRDPQFNGQGSGVLITEDGYILTNRHVIDGARKIKVALKDGREFPAVLRGIDTQSDLAIVKIEGKGFPVAKFADSKKVRIGEFAIAIGAPFALDYSVTVGHVSAQGRNQVVQDAAMDQDFLQTDASINPGNSGGPLVNIDGEIIGINTMIRGMNTGIGFSIPSSFAKEIAGKIMRDGRVIRAWLGVAISGFNENPEYKTLIKGVTEGVVVKEVTPEGPAGKADLKVFDVITAVEGKSVDSGHALRSEMRFKEIGKPVTLDVVRNGKSIKLQIVPEAWPEPATEIASKPLTPPTPAPVVPQTVTDANTGLTVSTITKELAAQHKVKESSGLLVTKVAAGSLAAAKMISEGDVITEINQKPVKTLQEFTETLRGADFNNGVTFAFQSKGASKSELLKKAAN